MTTNPGPHSAWTHANGERADGHKRKRDPLDLRYYHGEPARMKTMPGLTQVVECQCGEKTIARSPDAETLAGWTVGEWPAQPQEWGKVAATCRKCNKASAAQVPDGMTGNE